jgi:WD40 repeat protein
VDLTQEEDGDNLTFPAVLFPSAHLPGLPRQQTLATSSPRLTPAHIPHPGTARPHQTHPPEIGRKPATSGVAAPMSGSQTTNSNGAGSSERPGKRRKLSSLPTSVARPQPGPTPSRIINRTTQPLMANRPPSVQDMNAALKTNSGTSALVEEIAASQPRPLHIAPQPSRMPSQIIQKSVANRPPSAQNMNAALKANGGISALVAEIAASQPRPFHIDGWPAQDCLRVLQGPSSSRPGESSTRTTNSKSTELEESPPTLVKSRVGVELAQQAHRSSFPGPIALAQTDYRDSVMSDTSGGQVETSTPTPKEQTPKMQCTIDREPLATSFTRRGDTTPSTIDSNIKRSRPTNPTVRSFSEKEEHLLIFLKEEMQMTWQTITAEFNKDYPGRSCINLQSRYSFKLKKRDRSQDPAVWDLPLRWQEGNEIDGPSVDTVHSIPKERPELANLGQGATSFNMRALRAADFSADHQSNEQDQSPREDLGPAPRRERTRRAAPVNYTWPRQRRGDLGEKIYGGEETIEKRLVSDSLSRSETPEELVYDPATAIVVENEPMVVDDSRNAALALYAPNQTLPYLTSSQRLSMQTPGDYWQWDQLSSRPYQGMLLHVDFSPAEMDTVDEAFTTITNSLAKWSRHTTHKRHLRAILKPVAESKLLQLAHELRRRLPSRDSRSLNAFLLDAKAGLLSDTPLIQRLAAAKFSQHKSSSRKDSTLDIIRQRELGLHSRRGWKAPSKAVSYQIKDKMIDTLGPCATWTGASSDIHTVAWSQDGESFAAGAVAVTDPDSMQYNRANNLLYGILRNRTIHELGEHCEQRRKTATGANSTHAMHESQDPMLYTTVTSVAFSGSGKVMYSGGYDQALCIWQLDTPLSQPVLCTKLRQRAKVDMLVANRRHDGVLATAVQKSEGAAVKLLRINEENPSIGFTKINFRSAKAASRADLRILPQALRFEPRYGELLLAGFGANGRNDVFNSTGDLCIWDVGSMEQLAIYGANRNVFDVSFNPNRRYMPLFAAGCVANGSENRGTRSVIRLFDERGGNARGNGYTSPLEIECKARDMNDVVWCPQDEHLIAAGCTDGRVYVWDMRRSDDPLRTLSHGRSLMPLQEGIHHELTDTGVRFLSWGDNATRLYSGSSDGIVKVWDVTRSQEDTFVKDLIKVDSGIMAGAFSPDFSKLVIGEVNGSVDVLDVGRDDYTVKDANRLTYVPYARDVHKEGRKANEFGSQATLSASNSGVEEGNILLRTQQLSVARMGNLPILQVLQGPAYEGPFDRAEDAETLREQAVQFQLSMEVPPIPQCEIEACWTNVVTITSEEAGDSGRSVDRIPDELRRQWLAIEKTTPIPGKAKCTQCSRPARPTLNNDLDAPILCERCSFACFRCGSVNPIAAATTELICGSCSGVWDIGALGYECVQQPSFDGVALNVPPLPQFGRDMRAEQLFDDLTSFGDEMNALTDYYFSLAVDRSESPPV